MNKPTLSIYTISNERLAYLKFLLVGDNFDISELLRNKASDWGMDVLYDTCDIIATAGVYYDEFNENYNKLSEYDSFCNFLKDYDVPIRQLIGGEDVDLVELLRSDYEQNQ